MIIQNILMDMEFYSTKYELMGKTLENTSAAEEHVAEIERCIHTVKERCRTVASDLQFNYLHKTIVINMIYFCILWLNAFLVKNGISQEFSPRSIVVRTKLSWKKHCCIKVGDYAEVHNEPDPNNTISPCTHPEIAVVPTGNFNGIYKFFCLITGRILKRRNFTWYPMPYKIIKQKNARGKKTKREVYENLI